MPAIFNLVRGAAWRKQAIQQTSQTVHALMQPFDLARLYPAREVTLEDGRVEERHTILPQQLAVHNSTAKFVLHNGGFGSAKTMGWCVELTRMCLQYPGIRIVVTAGYDYYFDEFWNPTFQEVCPGESAHIKEALKRKVTFHNGSEIRLKAYAEPNRIRGWKAHIILIIEAAELAGGDNTKALLIWKALLGRLRAGPRVINGVKYTYPLRMFLEQNPAGHNWVWKTFIKGNPKGDIGSPQYDAQGKITHYEYRKTAPGGDEYFAIRSGTFGNPFLAGGYAETLKEQMSDDPLLLERFVNGAFTPMNVLVYDYPRYSEATHVVRLSDVLRFWETPEIPTWWPCFVGIDCAGLQSPWAAEFFVELPDGALLCIGEIYESGLQWGEMAAKIKEAIEDAAWENVRYFIDPRSAAQRQGQNSQTIAMEFKRHGITVVLPAGYGKSMGIRRVWDLLSRDKKRPCPYLADKFDEERQRWEIGKANLYYVEGACPNLLLEKTRYKFLATPSAGASAGEADEEAILPEIVEDKNDHAQTAEMFMALGRKPRTEADRKATPRAPAVSGGQRRKYNEN